MVGPALRRAVWTNKRHVKCHAPCDRHLGPNPPHSEFRNATLVTSCDWPGNQIKCYHFVPSRNDAADVRKDALRLVSVRTNPNSSF